ncbi:TPA: DUF1642 domain-containing protein [Streptococcus suis]|nr:DUF1642 domain-containing protein [Streptococcus suis]
MNKQEAIKRVEELYGYGSIAKTVTDIISQIDQPQQVVVSQVAVDYYERYKDQSTGFDEWFGDFYDGGFLADFPQGEKLAEWLYDNDDDTNRQRELALATLIVNGPGAVEVEQEQLYTVEIPNPNTTHDDMYILGRTLSGNVAIWRSIGRGDNKNYDSDFKLTEAEIKQDFEWAWQFAKEVNND